MAKLCRTLAAMEESLVALERRGISLRTHALRQDPVTRQAADLSRLPRHAGALVHHAAKNSTPSSRSTRKKRARNRSSVPPPALLPAPTWTWRRHRSARPRRTRKPTATPAPRACTSSSCTKCARSTRCLGDLARMGFDIQSLIPQERTGTEEPRYVLRRGEHATGLEDLRGSAAPSAPPAKRA